MLIQAFRYLHMILSISGDTRYVHKPFDASISTMPKLAMCIYEHRCGSSKKKKNQTAWKLEKNLPCMQLVYAVCRNFQGMINYCYYREDCVYIFVAIHIFCVKPFVPFN